MARLAHAYRILNILSIDVVVGALVNALFFARIFDVTILPYGLAALALTVWIIYTADHLNDARTIRNKAFSERHFFHQRHFKVLAVAVIGATIMDIILIFFIRAQVFFWGIPLAVAVLVYLIVQRKLYFLKELFVSTLYTCGVLLPSLAATGVYMSRFHMLIIIQFGILALINLLIFSWFDNELDQKHNQHSFVTWAGVAKARRIIWILIIILIFIGIFQVVVMNGSPIVSLIMLLMTSILAFIFAYWKFFSKNDYYRLLGDAVFFIPAIVLL